MRYYKINRLFKIYFIPQKKNDVYQPIIEYRIFLSAISEFVNKEQIKDIVKELKKIKYKNFPLRYVELIVLGCIKIIKKRRNN